MFEYPLINYLPQFIMATLWFFPGFVLGCIMGWRAHITYSMALDGSLQKEGEAQGIKLSSAQDPTAEEASPVAEDDDDDDPWY